MNELERPCPHCTWMTAKNIFHTKTCKCSHHHADHTSFGGCNIEKCECGRYDQTSPPSLKLKVDEEEATNAIVKDIKGLEEQVKTNAPGEMSAKLHSVKKLRALAEAQKALEEQ